VGRGDPHCERLEAGDHAVGDGEEAAGHPGVGRAFAPDEPVAALLDFVRPGVFGAAQADEIGVAGADDVCVLGAEEVADDTAGAEHRVLGRLLGRSGGKAGEGRDRAEHEESPYLAHRIHGSYRQNPGKP
jgi:hypothetical protein